MLRTFIPLLLLGLFISPSSIDLITPMLLELPLLAAAMHVQRAIGTGRPAVDQRKYGPHLVRQA